MLPNDLSKIYGRITILVLGFVSFVEDDVVKFSLERLVPTWKLFVSKLWVRSNNQILLLLGATLQNERTGDQAL